MSGVVNILSMCSDFVQIYGGCAYISVGGKCMA